MLYKIAQKLQIILWLFLVSLKKTHIAIAEKIPSYYY